MYRVVISPSANADLVGILNYIVQEFKNPQAASTLAEGIERCYADLAEMPSAHALCDDPVLRLVGYRKYPVGNYLVIFRVVENVQEVRVVHIFHERQDCTSIQLGEI